MDKKALVVSSEILAEFALPKAKKDESFEGYVNRAYNSFDDYVEKQSEKNSAIEDFKNTISRNADYNAVAKVEVRKAIVSRYCETNDQVMISEPEEATTADILEHNGLPKDLDKSMDKDAFENLIKKLKTPKSQGLTKTERQEMIENHHAKYEPAFPSEKTHTHGQGGTVRGWHWQASIQPLYLEDHLNFVDAYNIEDRFHSEPETETETETES